MLTLNPKAQRAALEALGTRCGAVVALEVRTGKVRVMASSPTYDPNLVEGHFNRVTGVRADCKRPDALLNRATAGLYAPGSIFKVITASAAIDSGRFKPTSSFVDPATARSTASGSTTMTPTSPFGRLDLASALKYSVNSVFCNIGKELGGKVLVDYAKRFGFYSIPPLETPRTSARRAASTQGRALRPDGPGPEVDPGRLAFGQERMLVTPLQMAMVAATIANNGIVMRAYVVDRIVSPNGSIVVRRARRLGRAVKPETAAESTR